MKKLLTIALIIGLVAVAVSAIAEQGEIGSAAGSAQAELEIGFETQEDGAPEAAQFLAELRQSAVTAELTLQQLNGGRILRAEVILHAKLFVREIETIECWYEIERMAEVPHITVIEKNKKKDTYYELDIHKLPGGMEAAKALNRALEAVWNQSTAQNGEAQKIQVPPERTAELLAAWVNVNRPGEGQRAAADFGGARLSVEWNTDGNIYKINGTLELSAQQTAILLGMQSRTAGESRVHINANMKLYGSGSAAVNMPQIPQEQWIDANLLIDKKLFDSDRVTVLYNGTVLQFDAQPRLENGTTMVPIRGIMEAAGVPPEQIAFDGTRGTVTIQDGKKAILLTLGSTTAFVNGKEVQLLCAAYEAEGRTFVPLRFVSEELGFQVAWTGLDQPNGICNGGVVRLER
ncbi:MAG: copper amine oxidase N-terminal domain-containing protein [Clostridia bacterium]|nr:copper amine oxidase N-terminal domain-containing protein [Clostridia bacterium]